MSYGCIIDGQDLYRSLVCKNGPVDKFLQITEIAYSKATFTSKREYGNSGSCNPCLLDVELYFYFFRNDDLFGMYLITVDHSIVMKFPLLNLFSLCIAGYKLIFHWEF